MAEAQPRQETLPSTVDAVAASVLVVYAAGEQRVVTGSAALVKAAIDNPALAPSLYGRLRALSSEVASQVLGRVHQLASQAVDVASRNGNASAAREMRALERRAENFVASPISEMLPHNVTASAAMTVDLTNRLAAAAQRITRYADDAYRAATTAGALVQINPALDVIHGVLSKATPAEAQAQAWRELTSRGITGFTDSAGREWNLATYVEMATRTATQRAYNASHRERLTLAGINYFTISTTGRPCPLCAPWEGKVLADTPGEVTEDGNTFTVSATIEEATAAGLFHPNCFPGFVPVSSPSGVRAADSRWYEGDVVIIKTASGNELTVTPNHPVLTPQGWVAAGELVVGGDVLSYGGDVEGVDGMRPDDELVPTPIGDVFDALTKSGAVLAISVPASPEQFHGDGEGSDVKVVFSRGFLEDNGIDAALLERLSDLPLFGSGVGLSDLFGSGSLDEIGLDPLHSPDGLMGGVSDLGSLCGRHALIAALSSLGLGDVRPSGDKPPADTGLTDSEGGRDLALSLAGKVTLDSIVNIRTREFAGHVYNLQSGDGWYVASSIVVHNCKHTLTAYLPGFTVLKPNQWTALDEQNYKNTQRLRALEREVRRAKQVQAAALNDTQRAQASREVRAAQANVRDFTARTGLLRRPRREQLNLGNK